ncbi:MAG: nucleoside triphosphate pyrophosphohydrolase [Eggerthellaceae bacterium]|nr:nucleoside triphosphate pyrophosphohydrolase [Eggerthellaceae bacterium]
MGNDTEGVLYFDVPTPESSVRHPEYDMFVQTSATLRAPGGCPWDAKQTHASIAKNMIEEAYEAVAAIEEGDIDHLREELGDVLLEVVLQAQIAADAGEFTMEDVAHDVNEKIIRRHPHVFGAQAAFAAAGLDPGQVEGADAVEDLWDVIKAHERKMKEAARAAKREAAGLDPAMPEGLLEGVSASQPALMETQEISRKAVAVGFEWETVDDVWDKVAEEIAEFKAAPPRSHEAELEFGDILFALVNVARKEHLDAESCLRAANAKFRARWQHMEQAAYEQGRSIDSYGIDGLEELWQQAKAGE